MEVVNSVDFLNNKEAVAQALVLNEVKMSHI